MMCWHKWSKWEEKDVGNLVKRETQVVVGRYVYQERVCEKCNLKQIKADREYYI